MTTQLLIYKQAVPVSKDEHADWSLKKEADYSFSQEVNSVPLLTTEFAKASLEYPVVFVRTEDMVMPMVVFSVQAQQNLYVSETGEWLGKYIPAFIRRYPFVFSSTDDGKTLTLCIDEEYSGWNQEGRGERLFDSEKEQTQYLNNVLDFLQLYQAQFQYTGAFCEKLQELDLLEPMEAQFTTTNNQQESFGGFLGVSREKLKNISSEQLFSLMQSDWLELIYLHIQSLNHFSVLVEKSELPQTSELVEESGVVA